MDLNRNHYFMLGLVVLFLGIQVKFVQTYTLTEDAARFVDKNFRKGKKPAEPEAPVSGVIQSVAASASVPASRRSFQPPQAVGWALISIGAVLILHSLALPRPGG